MTDKMCAEGHTQTQVQEINSPSYNTRNFYQHHFTKIRISTEGSVSSQENNKIILSPSKILKLTCENPDLMSQ